jgi:predicted branched-subunit amino acid permease
VTAEASGAEHPPPWPEVRGPVLRAALSVGVATGAYGLSFGALATASGLTVTQACALSVLTFSGGSQFALIGVLGAGGNVASGSASAILLGARNLLYGARLAAPLGLTGWRRFLGAVFVLDESTAVALASEDRGDRATRLGFWATGVAVFVLWNAMTLVGAIVGDRIGDARTYGLDAAAAAAFCGLLWPRLKSRDSFAIAGLAAVVAVLVAPHAPAGVQVLAASVAVLLAGRPRPKAAA